jgi:hypothetical protein
VAPGALRAHRLPQIYKRGEVTLYELTITIKFKSLLKGDIIKRRLQFAIEKMAPCDEATIEVLAKECEE